MCKSWYLISFIVHWQRKAVPPLLFRYVFMSFYLHWVCAALLMFLLEITKYKLMNFFLIRKKLNTKNKIVHKHVCMLGVSGLCLNKQWNFPAFLFPYLFFVCVVFSVLQCITWHYPSKFELQRISWKQFGPERSCQADKTFLLSFTLKCSFFFQHPKYTRQPNCWHLCEGAVRLLHSFMPHYAKLHIVYLKNTEHFSTIKKHVI